MAAGGDDESCFGFLFFRFSMSLTEKLDVLAPFEIWEVLLDDSAIKFHEPLVLEPVPLPDDPEEPCEPGENNYLQIECPELNISTAADNRDDLLEFVHSDIRFAWRRIVRADEKCLDPKSRTIKKRYLALAEEVTGG